jgi:hypothetical protein
MLQFAKAYNLDWTENIGQFSLPSVLERDASGKLRWRQQSCSTLAEADSTLRSLMGIAHDARLPLLAD